MPKNAQPPAFDAGLYGRVNALWFLLEVTWANALVDQPEEYCEALFSQVINRSRQTDTIWTTSGPKAIEEPESDIALLIGQQTTQQIERFCTLVRDRRNNLREIRSRPV